MAPRPRWLTAQVATLVEAADPHRRWRVIFVGLGQDLDAIGVPIDARAWRGFPLERFRLRGALEAWSAERLAAGDLVVWLQPNLAPADEG